MKTVLNILYIINIALVVGLWIAGKEVSHFEALAGWLCALIMTNRGE